MLRRPGRRSAPTGVVLGVLAIVVAGGCSAELQGGVPGRPSATQPTWPAWPGSALTLVGLPVEMGPGNGRHWWLTQPRVTGSGALASSGDPAYQLRLIAPPCRKSVTAAVTIDGRTAELSATAVGTVVAVPNGGGEHELQLDIMTSSCNVDDPSDPRDLYAGLLLELLPGTGAPDPSRNSE